MRKGKVIACYTETGDIIHLLSVHLLPVRGHGLKYLCSGQAFVGLSEAAMFICNIAREKYGYEVDIFQFGKHNIPEISFVKIRSMGDEQLVPVHRWPLNIRGGN